LEKDEFTKTYEGKRGFGREIRGGGRNGRIDAYVNRGVEGREGLHHTYYRRRGNPVKDTIITCGEIK